MCLCLFDINYTSTPYIQIISYYSSIIGFKMIACFCTNIPFIASSVILGGSATLITFLPFISRPFDTSEVKVFLSTYFLLITLLLMLSLLS